MDGMYKESIEYLRSILYSQFESYDNVYYYKKNEPFLSKSYINSVKIAHFEWYACEYALPSILSDEEKKNINIYRTKLHFKESIFSYFVKKKKIFLSSFDVSKEIEEFSTFVNTVCSSYILENKAICIRKIRNIYDEIMSFKDVFKGLYDYGLIKESIYVKYPFYSNILKEMFDLVMLTYKQPTADNEYRSLAVEAFLCKNGIRSEQYSSYIEKYMGIPIRENIFPRKLLHHFLDMHNKLISCNDVGYKVVIFCYEMSKLPKATQKKINNILSKNLHERADKFLLNADILTYDDVQAEVGLYHCASFGEANLVFFCREGLCFYEKKKRRNISRLNTQYFPISLRHSNASDLFNLFAIENEKIVRQSLDKKRIRHSIMSFVNDHLNAWIFSIENDDLRTAMISQRMDSILGSNMLPVSKRQIEKITLKIDNGKFSDDMHYEIIPNDVDISRFVKHSLERLSINREDRPVIRKANFAKYDPEAYSLILTKLKNRTYIYNECDLIVCDKSSGMYTLVKLEKESLKHLNENYDTENLVSACKLWIKESGQLTLDNFSSYGKSLYTLTPAVAIFRIAPNEQVDNLMRCAIKIVKEEIVKTFFEQNRNGFLEFLFKKIMNYCTYYLKQCSVEEVERCVRFCTRGLFDMQTARMMKSPLKGMSNDEFFPVLIFYSQNKNANKENLPLYVSFYLELKKNEGFLEHCYNSDIGKAWKCAEDYFHYFAKYNKEYSKKIEEMKTSELYSCLHDIKEIVRFCVYK